MSQRVDFINERNLHEESMTSLCSRFGISAKTGYKWIKRHQQDPDKGLNDLSRRPLSSPGRTSREMESKIIDIRVKYPRLGGRKIHQILVNTNVTDVPSPSTITDILRRKGLIDPREAKKHKPFIRFEHESPNLLWQMDFKGYFPLQNGVCHPLTVLDDHSRFCVGLKACDNEKGLTVINNLTDIFRKYGIPLRMTMDRGSPWGNHKEHHLTAVTVWLIRVGIKVGHSTAYHPQTQGKDERYHRSLKEEWLPFHPVDNLIQAQIQFDEWLNFYNYIRPHWAINMKTPADRYKPSVTPFPETLPDIEYDIDDIVRKVQSNGEIHFLGRIFTLSRALHKLPVALRHTDKDNIFDVHFCHQRIKTIDLNNPDL